MVNNHISWLDIVAINALRPMRALAKKEIAGWPVLGGLVRRGGSIFLDRERLKTLPATMSELADALRSGSLVSVTPEGTTWCGLASGRFTTATFQAAIDGGVPVRPIALRYRLADGRETSHPAFIGPESLIASLRRVAALRGLVLEVHICPEIAPGRAETRHELAALAEASVHSALGTVQIPAQQRRMDPAPAGRADPGRRGGGLGVRSDDVPGRDHAARVGGSRGCGRAVRTGGFRGCGRAARVCGSPGCGHAVRIGGSPDCGRAVRAGGSRGCGDAARVGGSPGCDRTV